MPSNSEIIKKGVKDGLISQKQADKMPEKMMLGLIKKGGNAGKKKGTKNKKKGKGKKKK